MQLGKEIRAGMPVSWLAKTPQASLLVSFPRASNGPSVHQASAVCISDLKLLRVHCVSFGACSLQTYAFIFSLSVLFVICGWCGPPYKPALGFFCSSSVPACLHDVDLIHNISHIKGTNYGSVCHKKVSFPVPIYSSL